MNEQEIAILKRLEAKLDILADRLDRMTLLRKPSGMSSVTKALDILDQEYDRAQAFNK